MPLPPPTLPLILAQGDAGARELSRATGIMLLAMTVALGVIGIVVVLLLLRAWGRYLRRVNRPGRRRDAQPVVDPWLEAGHRAGVDDDDSDSASEGGPDGEPRA